MWDRSTHPYPAASTDQTPPATQFPCKVPASSSLPGFQASSAGVIFSSTFSFTLASSLWAYNPALEGWKKPQRACGSVAHAMLGFPLNGRGEAIAQVPPKHGPHLHARGSPLPDITCCMLKQL